MKKRILAVVLTIALVISVNAVSVWADEASRNAASAQNAPAAQLRFEDLDARMRKSYPALCAIEESIAVIRATDYEAVEDQLREALNMLAEAQWSAISPNVSGLGPLGSMMAPIFSMVGASTAQTLEEQYDAVRKQYDDLKSGDMQKSHADMIRQLENVENGVIMMGQTLYLTLLGLEDSAAALERQSAALDRTIEEMELRYKLGQISALTLSEVRAGKTQLESGRATLEMNIGALRRQLNAMAGEEITAQTVLTALPSVTDAELAEMDVERDLGLAKAASYELYTAKQDLDDADKTFKDAKKEYEGEEEKFQFVQARHTWQAAQYTYASTVQNFEINFRNLYAKVKDNRQILSAQKAELESERENCKADELRYQLGNISYNALMTARDDLAAAEASVKSAEYDLFSAYLSYRWAVDHGILNSQGGQQ